VIWRFFFFWVVACILILVVDFLSCWMEPLSVDEFGGKWERRTPCSESTPAIDPNLPQHLPSPYSLQPFTPLCTNEDISAESDSGAFRTTPGRTCTNITQGATARKDAETRKFMSTPKDGLCTDERDETRRDSRGFSSPSSSRAV